MRALILVALLPFVFSEKCGENQHFELCGTACPLTCENHLNPPKICILSCNPGCHCDKGYVKTEDGDCVKPISCSKSEECGENQHYESCGTACPLTCENHLNPPKFCVLMCNPGCHCDKGYVKTKDGRCVKPFSCPESEVVCGENQRYLQCGSACPLTCDNYDNPPKICPAMCVSGCHCEEGFVKTSDGRCVKSEDCPAKAAVEKTCLGGAETGMCKAYMPSFYYDAETRTCKRFIYGGCGGNGNRYRTEEECMSHCAGVLAAPDACSLPRKVGVCRGYFPRYYFDKDTGKCEKFIYGGCGGNENNFNSLEDCESVCGSS